jgi:hypothetical protein
MSYKRLSELLPLSSKEDKIINYKRNSETGYKFNKIIGLYQDPETYFKNLKE